MTSAALPWDPSAFRARVQRELDAFVDTQADGLSVLGPDAALLVDAARTAVSGGKRFRAMFCWWGFQAVRAVAAPAEELALLRAAAALELLHASALVHDDLMDASDTRRGRPSVHRAFEARHRSNGWTGDPVQYGEAAAILLGDLLLVWSDELLRTSGFGDGAVLEALRFFDTTRTEVVTGQFLDVSVQARGRSEVEDAMRVLRYKSAKYSVERPLHVGAALAGGSDGHVAALSAYGVPLGEAFQLRDDLLGVFGDPEVTGKPAGDDLSEGKRTVLVALAMESLGPTDGKVLEDGLGRALEPREVRRLRKVIRGCGAEADVESRIEALTADALAALRAPVLAPEAKPTLRQLAEAATQRVV